MRDEHDEMVMFVAVLVFFGVAVLIQVFAMGAGWSEGRRGDAARLSMVIGLVAAVCSFRAGVRRKSMLSTILRALAKGIAEFKAGMRGKK